MEMARTPAIPFDISSSSKFWAVSMNCGFSLKLVSREKALIDPLLSIELTVYMTRLHKYMMDECLQYYHKTYFA
jgi:hypothetical protein